MLIVNNRRDVLLVIYFFLWFFLCCLFFVLVLFVTLTKKNSTLRSRWLCNNLKTGCGFDLVDCYCYLVFVAVFAPKLF